MAFEMQLVLKGKFNFLLNASNDVWELPDELQRRSRDGQ
jgi:hypothetical protein